MQCCLVSLLSKKANDGLLTPDPQTTMLLLLLLIGGSYGQDLLRRSPPPLLLTSLTSVMTPPSPWTQILSLRSLVKENPLPLLYLPP